MLKSQRHSENVMKNSERKKIQLFTHRVLRSYSEESISAIFQINKILTLSDARYCFKKR